MEASKIPNFEKSPLLKITKNLINVRSSFFDMDDIDSPDSSSVVNSL